MYVPLAAQEAPQRCGHLGSDRSPAEGGCRVASWRGGVGASGFGLKQVAMVGGARLGIQEFRLWGIGEGGWVSAGLLLHKNNQSGPRGGSVPCCRTWLYKGHV